VFTVRHIVLGGEAAGTHLFSATVTNRTDTARTIALDIRTEADGLGVTNWQKQFSFPLRPKEVRSIQAEYEIATPLLNGIVVRFGEAPKYYRRKEVTAASVNSTEKALRDAIQPYGLSLNWLAADRLVRVRREILTPSGAILYPSRKSKKPDRRRSARGA